MRVLISLFLFFCLYICKAQNKEAAWWVLSSKQRIDFNSGQPVLDTFANSFVSTQTFSTSDKFGNLKIYGAPPTDATNVLLTNSNQLPPAFIQDRTAIIKKPNKNSYIIISMSGFNSNNQYLYEVDSNLNVITNTITSLPFPPNFSAYLCVPGVFLHTNNTDYWVVFQSDTSNSICSFLITQNGISTTIVSNQGIGGVNSVPLSNNQHSVRGSPKSNFMTIHKNFQNNNNRTEVYRFDRATGTPSALILSTSYYRSSVFSPSEKKFYCINEFELSQFDFTNLSVPAILSSRKIIDSFNSINSSFSYTDGSLAIDGKVYISQIDRNNLANGNNNALNIIECPEEEFPYCNYKQNILRFNFYQGNYLPFQNQTFFRNADSLQAQVDGPDKICVGDTILLSAYGAGADSFFWFPQAGLDNPHSNRPRAFPQQTTTYYAIGYKQCGAPDTAYVTITVHPKLKPQLTATNTTFCAGDSAAVYLNNPSLFDSIFWSNGIKNQVTIHPKSSGNFWMAAIDTNGCKTLNSDTIATIQNQLPIKPIISASPNDTICFGETAQLSVFNKQSGWRYSWSSGDTVSNITIGASADLQITITDTNSCKNKSDTLQLRVNQLPPKPILSIVPNDSICLGDSATIFVQNPQTDWRYRWSTADTTANVQVKQTANMFVVNTDTNGCKNQSDTLRFVVLSLPPKPTLSVLPNDTICYGDVATVSKNAAANLSHEWFLNNEKKGQSTTIQTDSAATIVLLVTDAFGCQNSSDSLQIVLEVPAPPIAFQGTDTFCQGDSLVLSVACCPIADGYSYLWSNGNKNNAITITESGNYSVQITNITNCKSPVSQTVFVAVNELPQVVIQTQDSVLCIGENTILSVVTNATNPLVSWSNASQAESIKVDLAANYTVTITDQNNCSNTTSKFVRKGIETDCSFSPNPVTGFAPLAVQLSNTSSNAIDFFWNFGNETFSSELSPTVIYESGGDYKISLRCESADGCVDSATYQFIKVNDELTVYIPNSFSPNSDGINDFFEVFTKGAASLKMKVFNRIGEKVFESENDQLKWDGYYKGVLQEAGNYVYQIQLFSKYKTVKTYKGTVTIIR
jgi:gliding motility-associated-like protein